MNEVQTPEAILEASAASPAFKDAVQALIAGRAQDRIQFAAPQPPVKALRFALKMLEALPGEAFESVAIQAVSSCSGYIGHATARTLAGVIRIDFKWDCAWRARERGWTDAFGDPDQIRAAQEWGYQCFEEFIVNR